MKDLIYRQDAIDALEEVDWYHQNKDKDMVLGANPSEHQAWYKEDDIFKTLEALPSAQPEKMQLSREDATFDCISRQAAIDALHMHLIYRMETDSNKKRLDDWINGVPSVQPEQRTCVNCGRTANNGGWYADGGTRCPIEEHYALPKDGYCHLWEKRNVTDDDYPERQEVDGERRTDE